MTALCTGIACKGVQTSMAEEFEYISHSRLVYHEGYRYAYLGEVIQPVIYGVQGGLRHDPRSYRCSRRWLNVRHTCRCPVRAQDSF